MLSLDFVSAQFFFLLCFLPVATDGDADGRVPALSAEHLRRHLVPAVDLGGGNCRRAAGLLYCSYVLLLCEYWSISKQPQGDKNRKPL